MNLLEKIIPPDDPNKVTNWRWFIVIAVGALILNGMSGRGFLFDMGAYASESALVSQGSKIDRLLTLQIATTLRDLKQEECRANGSKAVIQEAIEGYQQQYIEIAGARYPLTRCEKVT